MVLLDVSIVNVALPSIATGIGADESDLQWIVSGYALAFGLVLVAGGRIGDARGRRPTLVFGLALFTLASLACGAAQDPTWLVVARLVQGIGGGLITPQNSRHHPEPVPRRGARPGLRPVRRRDRRQHRDRPAARRPAHPAGRHRERLAVDLPGQPADRAGRDRAGLPHGAARAAHRGRADRLRPDRRRAARRRRPCCCCCRFVESRTWEGAAKWLLLVPGVLLLAGFARWERAYRRRGREPMVDLALFARRSYTFGSTLGLAYFAGFTGVFFIYTQFLQEGVGYSALQAGLASTPFAVGAAVAAGLGGRVVYRIGRSLVAIGLVLVIVGLVGSWVAIGLVSGPAVGWAVAAAVPRRRPRQRPGDLAEPDAHPVRGAAPAGRRGRRRAADRAADRFGGRHRRGRQPLLRPAGRHPRRLRGRGPGRAAAHRALRRRRARDRRRGPRGQPRRPARRAGAAGNWGAGRPAAAVPSAAWTG